MKLLVSIAQQHFALVCLPEIGHFYEMKLTSPSRAIFIAQTMKEAARILEERDITLILLDLTLPDADGRSFLHRVRQNPRTSMVPIIVVSARRGPVSMSECFDLGADEYFEKPVHPDVLAAALNLSRPGAGRRKFDPLVAIRR